jgi:hypothetical protein
MAISFKDLKTSKKSDFEKLQKQIEDANKGSFGDREKDARFWQPGTDKAGNGFALIRFLPAPAGEEAAFVRLFSHGFKGPGGKWYIENSLTTLGLKDPVSEYNSELWAISDDDKSPTRNQARNQARRLNMISNIEVIKDPSNPENEGKVFLYRYGKKIWNKIHSAMYPEENTGEAPVNPFDLWEGANFKLKIRQVAGYRNYDESSFAAPSPLSNDDDELEAIWKQTHSLAELIAPDKFKTYDELKKSLESVMGKSTGKAGESADAPVSHSQVYQPRARSTEVKETASNDGDDESARSTEGKSDASSAEEDDLAFFRKLGAS